MESKGIERKAYITLPRDVFYLTAQKNPKNCRSLLLLWRCCLCVPGQEIPHDSPVPPSSRWGPPPLPNHGLDTARKETGISRARLSGTTKAPCKRPGAGRGQRGMLRAQPAFPLFVWKRRSQGGPGGMQERMLGMMLCRIRAPSATS